MRVMMVDGDGVWGGGFGETDRWVTGQNLNTQHTEHAALQRSGLHTVTYRCPTSSGWSHVKNKGLQNQSDQTAVKLLLHY